MKQPSIKTLLLFMLPLILACGLFEPAKRRVAQVPPTRTPIPTFTATLPPPPPTDTPPPDAAPAEVSVPVEQNTSPINTPTPVVIPTDTPAPTNTPLPPTNIPEPVSPPPPPTDTPVPAPAGPAVGQYGVSGKVTARDKTTFAVGEKAFFTYEANNHTEAPVSFGLLGIKASNGQFNTSWINPDSIQPGVPFRHDDGLTFDVPGTYQVFLAICYAFCDGGEAVWEEYPSGAATITVQ